MAGSLLKQRYLQGTEVALAKSQVTWKPCSGYLMVSDACLPFPGNMGFNIFPPNAYSNPRRPSVVLGIKILRVGSKETMAVTILFCAATGPHEAPHRWSAKYLYEHAPGELAHTSASSTRGKAFSPPSVTIPPPRWDIVLDLFNCTPVKSGLKMGCLSLLLQINCNTTFGGRTLLSRRDRLQPELYLDIHGFQAVYEQLNKGV